MTAAPPLGDGRYRHRESMPFQPKPPRARTVDAARVAQVIDRELDKALQPLRAEMQKLDRQLDAIKATNAATEAKLATVADRAMPLAAMRDNIRQGRRCPTPAKVNAAIRARYGRDVEGRHPGDLGFGLDPGAMRDAAAGSTSAAAAVNAANRKLWGRT